MQFKDKASCLICVKYGTAKSWSCPKQFCVLCWG